MEKSACARSGIGIKWIHFLRLVDDTTPVHKHLHLIVDNYATHKHPAVQPG
jgi:hypothetical protein